MIRKKKGLLLEGYHAGYCTREGYLEGGRELEQRISGLEQRRARIRDDMAECEKLPESERKGQEFLQLSEPDLGFWIIGPVRKLSGHVGDSGIFLK